MNKLLHADLVRLRKSKFFLTCIVAAFGFALFLVLLRYFEMKRYPNQGSGTDGLLTIGIVYAPIIIAAFLGIFIGTEYSDGTMRNKLIVGHSRFCIYFANLITAVISSFIIFALYTITIISFGLMLIGKFSLPADQLIKILFLSFVSIIAFSSIFVLTGMIITSKAAGAITAIISAFILLMAAVSIQNRLNEPEYYEPYGYTVTDENGNTHEEYVEKEKNVRYLTGTKRKIYEFLNDFLPYSQLVQVGIQESVPDDAVKFPLYSLFIIAATTVCGSLAFRRKDLK